MAGVVMDPHSWSHVKHRLTSMDNVYIHRSANEGYYKLFGVDLQYVPALHMLFAYKGNNLVIGNGWQVPIEELIEHHEDGLTKMELKGENN